MDEDEEQKEERLLMRGKKIITFSFIALGLFLLFSWVIPISIGYYLLSPLNDRSSATGPEPWDGLAILIVQNLLSGSPLNTLPFSGFVLLFIGLFCLGLGLLRSSRRKTLEDPNV